MEEFSSRRTPTLEEKVQQLKELFRISDVHALRILQQHDEDLERVISLMDSVGGGQVAGGLEEGGAAPDQTARSAGDGAVYTVDQATGTEKADAVLDPIDLTKEGGDQDMQRALMLSMQDMQSSANGVISLEEQELSRALEASLRENNVNMSKPVLALFQDPKNPHKRKRIGNTPVGLKNIGNTCWFSAVIQSLYHIPAFRQEILNYSPPPLPSDETSPYPQCVTFVLELQKIFGLLLKSNKMYIDPSPAIQALQGASSKEYIHTGTQQDVSEFTHKLLEWIENAFKLSLESNPSDSGNPIVKLFNGNYKTEGVNNDEAFINESDFGAYPVQVRGHTHLHESLESATFNTEMQQQTFFTRFPPILVLELSRFHFNQLTQQAEKIHDRLNFDLQLYVDRYLEENKAEACRRKAEVDQLRRKIEELSSRLEQYLRYRQKPVAITDILSLTLSFVRDEKIWEEKEEEQRGEGQAEKRPRTSLYPSPRYKSEQELEILQKCLERWTEELSQDMEDLQASIAASRASLDAVYSDPMMNKTPYFLHAVMVHQGEASRGHYWTYTRKHPSLSALAITKNPQPYDKESTTAGDTARQKTGQTSLDVVGDVTTQTRQTVGGLESIDDNNISNPGQATRLGCHTHLETGEVYSDSMQSPGSAVSAEDAASMSSVNNQRMIHSELPSGPSRGEGMEVEKCGGFGDGSDVWLKFNDVSVSEVSWDEVRRESLGEMQQNTSAYCLVYVSKLLHENWLRDVTPPSLNEVLLEYVEENNSSFLKEMLEHDRDIQAARHISSDVTVSSSDGPPPSPLPVMMSPMASSLSVAPSENALPAGPRHEERSPQELMQIDSPPPPPLSPGLQAKLSSLVSAHNYRIHQLSKQYTDPRLLNISAYATHSGCSKHILRLLALSEIALNHSEDRMKMLAKREYIHGLSAVTEGNNNPLNVLKQSYESFIRLCYFFIQAMRAVRKHDFQESLLQSLKAYESHTNIVRSQFSLQPPHLALLHAIKCKSLQEVSSTAYRMFEQGEIRSGLQVANTLVVPALAQLSRESGGGGEEVLEKVREEWCQCLNRPDLNEGEQDQLGDLLTRILDDSGKSQSLLQRGLDIDLEQLNYQDLVKDMSESITLLTQHLSSNSFVGI